MAESDYVTGLQTDSDNAEAQNIMYYGTTLTNARKIRRLGYIPSSAGILGRGVYLCRSFQKALENPRNAENGKNIVVLKVKVWGEGEKQMNRHDHPLQMCSQGGYNTAGAPPNSGMVPSGLEEDCVWDPQKIQILEILNKDGTIRVKLDTPMYLQLTNAACP